MEPKRPVESVEESLRVPRSDSTCSAPATPETAHAKAQSTSWGVVLNTGICPYNHSELPGIPRSAGLLMTVLLLISSACDAPRNVSPGENSDQATHSRRSPMPLPPQTRAVWVARFHYDDAASIERVLDNCVAAGFNTVYWQVRGDASVAYPSRLEPWTREYRRDDPGFDPFAVAVAGAHTRGLRIEAWVNTLTGWAGQVPPPENLEPPHLYWARPSWFLRDATGAPQALNSHYVGLNPCLPAVRNHIAALVREIVTRYDVDGIHLDYVRYVWDDQPGALTRYPQDPLTLALYAHETGRRPTDSRIAWDAWRANQITRLVAAVRDVMDEVRPGATLTAAVWRHPDVAYREYLQNAAHWVRSGLVDAIAPMMYTRTTPPLAIYIASYAAAAPGQRVIPGLGVYMLETAAGLREQMQLASDTGRDFAWFSYESIFDLRAARTSTTPGERQAAELRAMRRSVLAEFMPVP